MYKKCIANQSSNWCSCHLLSLAVDAVAASLETRGQWIRRLRLGKFEARQWLKSKQIMFVKLDLWTYGSIVNYHELSWDIYKDLWFVSLDLKSIPITPAQIFEAIWGLPLWPTPALPVAAPQSTAQKSWQGSCSGIFGRMKMSTVACHGSFAHQFCRWQCLKPAVWT